jgi:hypothetical protein
MGCYYSRPPENCRYVPVESGARLDHWFGPGSSGPLEQYNQVLQRCVADDSGSGGGGGGGGFGAHSSGGGGGGGGQLRPSAEEVVRMLEDIHEGEGQAGEKTALFAPFIYKKDHFTKTGSGQT